MDKLFHPTRYWACHNLSMLGLIHISKRNPRTLEPVKKKHTLPWYSLRRLRRLPNQEPNNNFRRHRRCVKLTSWKLAVFSAVHFDHYSDVIMRTMASQVTSVSIVFSTVCSGGRKHQSSAPLAFVRRIHRWIPRTRDQLRGKYFHLMTSSCILWVLPTSSGDIPRTVAGLWQFQLSRW